MANLKWTGGKILLAISIIENSDRDGYRDEDMMMIIWYLRRVEDVCYSAVQRGRQLILLNEWIP